MVKKVNIKRYLFSLITLLIFVLITGFLYQGTTYYIDSIQGNDSNTGNSPDHSWASLDNINNHSFKPGDKILFKSGTEYFGQLYIKSSGEKNNPIIIDIFGGNEKPVIHGKGKFESTILLENVEFCEIKNLEITNKGDERKAKRTGVMIYAHDFGDCHHIYLNNLFIHDVNGSFIKNEGGGSAIYWKNKGFKKPTRFVDLRIENCHLLKCERNGIISSGYFNRKNWYPSIGVVIRNNILEDIPGDGIVPIGCDGTLIEYNIMRNCPDILPNSEAAAGIWPWSCDNTIIQYNQVIGHNAKWDGQGFDSDWNCRNTIIQYNYSCNNAGGFLLICNNGNNIGSDINIGTTSTIVRYNVSFNDGIREYPTKRKGYFSPIFHITGPTCNSLIYNNLIYIKQKKQKKQKDIDRTLIYMDNWGGSWPDSTLFANNIFYSSDTSEIFLGKSTANIFLNNLFSGNFLNPPQDKSNIFGDPLWVSAEMVNTDYKSLKGFMIKKESPCHNAGISISDHDITDFFGNKLNNIPSIGIHELK